MELMVIRGLSASTGTPGKLTSNDGKFSCDSQELPWMNNKRGISCILPGRYAAKLWFSPTMQRTVIRLEDKHSRKDCLIHHGNFAGDEASGYVTNVHGCTEVGRGFGEVTNKLGKLQYGILHSKETLDELIAHIEQAGAGGLFYVTYVWSEGCIPADPADRNGC